MAVTPFPNLSDWLNKAGRLADVSSRWLTGLTNQVNLSAAAVLQGAGSPETVVTAAQGTLYIRTDGGATTTLYAKTSGGVSPPTNTGWTAIS